MRHENESLKVSIVESLCNTIEHYYHILGERLYIYQILYFVTILRAMSITTNINNKTLIIGISTNDHVLFVATYLFCILNNIKLVIIPNNLKLSDKYHIINTHQITNLLCDEDVYKSIILDKIPYVRAGAIVTNVQVKSMMNEYAINKHTSDFDVGSTLYELPLNIIQYSEGRSGRLRFVTLTNNTLNLALDNIQQLFNNNSNNINVIVSTVSLQKYHVLSILYTTLNNIDLETYSENHSMLIDIMLKLQSKHISGTALIVNNEFINALFIRLMNDMNNHFLLKLLPKKLKTKLIFKIIFKLLDKYTKVLILGKLALKYNKVDIRYKTVYGTVEDCYVGQVKDHQDFCIPTTNSICRSNAANERLLHTGYSDVDIEELLNDLPYVEESAIIYNNKHTKFIIILKPDVDKVEEANLHIMQLSSIYMDYVNNLAKRLYSLGFKYPIEYIITPTPLYRNHAGHIERFMYE